MDLEKLRNFNFGIYDFFDTKYPGMLVLHLEMDIYKLFYFLCPQKNLQIPYTEKSSVSALASGQGRGVFFCMEFSHL